MRRAVGRTAQCAADSQAFDYGFALPEKTDARSLYFVAWSGQGYAHSSGSKSMELHCKMHQIALRCPSKDVRETERGRESLREIVSREISILKNLSKYVSALILILQCVSSRMRCLGTSLKSENIFSIF